MANFQIGLLGNENNRRLKPSNQPLPGGLVPRAPASYDESTKFLWQIPEEDRFRAELEQPPPAQAPYDDPLNKISTQQWSPELMQYILNLIRNRQ